MAAPLDYYHLLKAKGVEEEAFADMVAHRTQCRDAWLSAATGWYHAAQDESVGNEHRMVAYAHATECEARAAEYNL